MSSLREIVAARRAVEPSASPAPASSAPEPRTLQVEPGGCEHWLLAWSQFVSAHYSERAKQEELVLRFAEYEVVVHGHRLARLLGEVAALRLDCLRAATQPGMAAHGGIEAAVTRIQIHVLNRSGQREESAESS